MTTAHVPESWKALLVVGIVFPLHIILGVLSIPYLGFKLSTGSVGALLFLCCYLPFYLYPAQQRYPGWKGFDALWRFMDYSATCVSYFGQFAVHNPHGIDGDAQYFCACRKRTVEFELQLRL